MKKQYRIILVVLLLTGVVYYVKTSGLLLNPYQKDGVYISSNLLKYYSFYDPKKEEYYRNSRDDFIQMLKNCNDDEEFVDKVNTYFERLNSPHTKLNNRQQSFWWLFKYFPNIPGDEKTNSQYYMKHIASQPEIKEIYRTYLEKPMYSSMESKQKNLQMEDLIKGKVAYIHMASFSGNQIEKDKEQLFAYLKRVQYYPTLILDVRDNGGGNSNYFVELLSMLVNKSTKLDMYLLFRDRFYINEYRVIPFKENPQMHKEVAKLLEKQYPHSAKYILDKYNACNAGTINIDPSVDSIHYKGNIYILVNGNTGSSATYFATYVKGVKLGTVVGEETTPEGIGIDSASFVLPQTKLLWRMHYELSITPQVSFAKDGYMTDSILVPDILTGDATRYLKKNGQVDIERDQCIQKVLKLEHIQGTS